MGNLRKYGQCKPFQQYHYIVSDADTVGNLTKSVVFVQYLACRVSNQSVSLLLCKECDKGAEVVQQIVFHGDVTQKKERQILYSFKGCRTILS